MISVKRAAAMAGMTAALVAGAALAPSAAMAASDYTGAVYQVEISANTPQFGFWMWTELGSGGTGNYQETDCIHEGGGHQTDASSHDSGNVLDWSAAGGMLTQYGVDIIGGLATANISVPLDSSTGGPINSMTLVVTSEQEPFFPLGVPITLPATGTVAP